MSQSSVPRQNTSPTRRFDRQEMSHSGSNASQNYNFTNYTKQNHYLRFDTKAILRQFYRGRCRQFLLQTVHAASLATLC